MLSMIIISNIKDLVEADSILTWKGLLGTVMNFQGEKEQKYKIRTKFRKQNFKFGENKVNCSQPEDTFRREG